MEKLIGRTIGFLIALYLVSCIFGCQKDMPLPNMPQQYYKTPQHYIDSVQIQNELNSLLPQFLDSIPFPKGH
jgi:hypothetical protein